LVHEAPEPYLLFPDVRSPLVSMMLNRSAVAVSPERNRLVQAFLMSCRIHIVDSRGVLERQVAGPIDLKLEYGVYLDESDGQEKMSMHPAMKYCYTHVAASRDHVLALFAGNAVADHNRQMSWGYQLHVIRWDGSLVGAWNFEHPVQSIATDASGERLWAINAQTRQLEEYRISAPPRS
jgi:hypothetical protein